MPAMAQEVVQALPDPAVGELNDALSRLSRNPDSVPALVEAGRASLKLEDVAAAKTFFDRARGVEPGDPRVLEGLAVVAVRQRRAAEAVQLFAQAERAGASLRGFEADRGLAYDLVGDNARAQSFYGEALSREESNELIRRLALSYAIAGDREASEATLLPLLQRRDLAAYRARAFALAILGRQDEAVSIIETMLPERLATRLTPYMRVMPRLTKSQQAAAANLGVFPPNNQIGRDDSALAALDTSTARPAPGTSPIADSRLAPSGPALGSAQAAVQRQQAANARPTGTPTPSTTWVAQPTPAPAVAPAPAPAPAPVRQEVVQTAPAPAPAPTRELPALAQSPASSPQVGPPVASTVRDEPVTVAIAEPPPQQVARPSIALDQPTAPAPTPSPAPAPPPEPEIDLSQVFADLDRAELSTAPRADAVDIASLDIPRERAEPPAPAPAPTPPPPQVPSRQWVQVATGQDTNAFRFDWRRIARGAGGLLDDRRAFYAPWGQTNRLVTGPFDSAKAANDFVAALKAAGVDSFRFVSSAGEEVTEIANLPRVQSSAAPAAPSNPARQWVQVATGQDTSAFRFDWRRIARGADGLLDGRDAFYAPWGQTNRLLTGPFESEKAANDFVARLKAAGVDSFRFASAAGEAVTALSAR